MAAITVIQRRSSNGSNKRQLDTLRSLGLRRIGHTVQVDDCPQARGMLHSVRHLVEMQESQLQQSARRARSVPSKRAPWALLRRHRSEP